MSDIDLLWQCIFMGARAFGPPPVPRSPGATAKRIASTADLILNKANTEQNK